MLTANNPPFLIVNIYLNINQKFQLPIQTQSEQEINNSIKKFVKDHKLKDKAIPIIRQAINKQIKNLKDQNNNFTNRQVNNILRKHNNSKKKNTKGMTDRTNTIAPLSHTKQKPKISKGTVDSLQPKSLQKKHKIITKSDLYGHHRTHTCKDQYIKTLTIKQQFFDEPFEGPVHQYKQYQMKDIEDQMHRQVNHILFSKIVDKKWNLVEKLYEKLTRNNPQNIKRIHPDYISFADLTEAQLCALQDFFELMTEKQLSSLNLENMKALLVKYGCDQLLKSLTF